MFAINGNLHFFLLRKARSYLWHHHLVCARARVQVDYAQTELRYVRPYPTIGGRNRKEKAEADVTAASYVPTDRPMILIVMRLAIPEPSH